MPGAESNRMSNYKNKGKSGDELRKKRTEVSVELRKKGRDDQLLKRRNIALDDEGEDANEINANTASYQNGGTGKAPTPMPTLEEIVKGVVWCILRLVCSYSLCCRWLSVCIMLVL